ncbi:MAG: Hsp70 family protein [Trueperaceae bacterium]|nr:Hsp70 family protein [Trueperaceae bacterium]
MSVTTPSATAAPETLATTPATATPDPSDRRPQHVDFNDLEIVGFDLGHGETALALAQVAATTEPQILDVQNKRSFISAVAVHPRRGVIIGEDAYTARQLDSLRVRFKSPDLDDPDVREPLRQFVGKIAETLRQQDLIRGDGQTHFVVGCPSGWGLSTRQRYEALLREAGLEPVRVVAESRAAFIHAKESSELRVSTERLEQSVLIVDVGSSTTDFTAVRNLSERYIDFGDVALGAGLLDRAILDRVLQQHPRRSELREVLERYPQYEAMCELTCRRVKESYFSNEARWRDEPASATLKLPTPEPIFFDVELTQADMRDILAQSLLNDQSWPGAFRDALRTARDQLTDAPPELVFLTGGASRMAFTAELCREVFPGATVLRGKEPELSIAKGLAWTGRIDYKAQAFKREVDDFLASGVLSDVVEAELPDLLERVADVLVDTLPDAVVLPCFRDWKRGRIKTLDGLGPEIERRSEAWLTSDAGKRALAPAVEDWFNAISPKIEAKINPICDRYGIPRTAFSLRSGGAWRGTLPSGLIVNPEAMFAFEGASVVTAAIVSVVVANLAGGGGVALILHGPIGFIIGLIIGAVAFLIGRQAAERWVRNADLPPMIRRLVREERVRSRIVENRADLKAHLVASFAADPATMQRIAEDVKASIRTQLDKSVEAVVMLIR